MFDKTARWYDAIYTSMKDYAAEAESLHDLVQRERPGATTLLDVACGTGLHDEHLRDRYQITGIDLDPNMLQVARERNPGIDYVAADMATFDLGRTFHAVACMFSSIAYMVTQERLRAAIASMRAHLERGGVLVIEPWITPEAWQSGVVHAWFVDQPDLKIARMSASDPIEDATGTLRFDYLIGTPEGVRHIEEEHRVGFFTHDQYLDAIRAAGLDARHDPEGGWANRGLYIGLAS